MHLKKIDYGKKFLERYIASFRCPICMEAFEKLEINSIICKCNHHFDLSKKGTINFLLHQVQTEYDKSMLLHRRKSIATGMYEPLLQKISQLLLRAYPEGMETLLDVGCGEGSFLNHLHQLKIAKKSIGFDISKDAILLASNYLENSDIFWCVADLTRLPFADHSVDTILNIFSPSQYSEFRRVLKTKGKILKIVPNSAYLKELRALFYQDQIEKQMYSNQKVVERFKQETKLVHQEILTYTFPVAEQQSQHVIKMSPLHWGASQKARLLAEKTDINEVTIDVEILVGVL